MKTILDYNWNADLNYDWNCQEATEYLNNLSLAKLSRRLTLVRGQQARAFAKDNIQLLIFLQAHENAIIRARFYKTLK